MQGEPRGVGTQLVLFTGPAGYHRSSAPTGLVRDKDSMGKNDRNSGKQQHEGGGGMLSGVKRGLSHYRWTTKGTK